LIRNLFSFDLPRRAPLAQQPRRVRSFVWSSKQVNTRKGNRLPHEAGLKLLNEPRAPKELLVTALLRNANGIAEWKLFLNE
jgi:hypothetical protein